MTTTVSESATIGLVVLAVWLAYRQFSDKKAKQLPPGPRKLPFIGSILGLPTSLEWQTYARWSKEYNSDILHVDALGNSIVIVNTYEAAEELLDKRSGMYSSRPHMPMFHDISGWGFQMTMLPYGDRWRASRRMFTQYFSPSNYAASRAREAFYTKRFLHQLLEHPEDFMAHIRHIVGGIAMSMSYGIETKAYNDPYITMIEEAVEIAHELMVPGAFYVDALPFLKYLPDWTPGAYFHKKGRIMREWSAKIREEPFKAAKDLIDTGLSAPSFVSESLKKLEDPGINEEEKRQLIVDVASIVYMAAADTTASALSTFFLAMTCYPKVQQKARAEIDSVVQDRLPTHEDLPRLPYLAAVIKETLRWATVVPIGLPHLVMADDIYKGYYIPGHSIVIANLWAISNDENEYPHPREFIPERYICGDKVSPAVRNPADFAFGFGRRRALFPRTTAGFAKSYDSACPGKHLALSTLTLAAASVLSTFDLLKKRDENGLEIEPKKEYNNMPLNKPLPFPCMIKPRSKTAEGLICASVAEDQ